MLRFPGEDTTMETLWTPLNSLDRLIAVDQASRRVWLAGSIPHSPATQTLRDAREDSLRAAAGFGIGLDNPLALTRNPSRRLRSFLPDLYETFAGYCSDRNE